MTRWSSWISDKKHKSIIPSTFITVVIIAMLIISGPAQAVQVSLTTADLNNRPAGDTGSFFIDVIIGANERIPLTYVSVEGLPDIDGSPGGKLVFNVSDFGGVGDFKKKGNYNISLIEQYGWVEGYGYGKGYIYNNNSPPYAGYGYGYQFYGYGYGPDNQDAYTKLRYKITVDTDGAKAAEYNVIARVNAGSDVTGNNVAFEGSLKFTLISQGGSPVIKNFSPPTGSVKNSEGEERTFSVTANQTVNVTWYINGTKVFGETNKKTSSYTNFSASKGTWNVTAIASNTNGAAAQKWDWVVTGQKKLKAKVEIKPETLNLASKGKFTALITSDLFDVEDIVVNSVEIEGAHPVKSEILKKNGGTLMLKFNTQDLENVHTGNAVVLKATGKVNTDSGLVEFEGSDTIRIIKSGKDGCGKDHDDDCEDDDDDCGELHDGDDCKENDDDCNEVHEDDEYNDDCNEHGKDIGSQHSIEHGISNNNIEIINNIKNNKGKIVIINNVYNNGNSFGEYAGEVQAGDDDHEDEEHGYRMNDDKKENHGKGKKKGKD